ncbi:MAG: CBS domain-containing protein, partial [Thermacetogeniaceae bacterium]
QREMKKTICFVTHDINEAIKMGDTIAIFEKGQLVQHGTPQEILSKPKNEFVRTFIGTDRVVKMLTLFQVRSITKDNYSIIRENELANIRQKMDDEGAAVGILMNESAKPCGLITRDDLEKAGELNPEKIKEIACGKKDAFIDGDLLLNDALSLMLEWNCDYLGVLDGAQLIGIVSFDDIRECVRRKEGE